MWLRVKIQIMFIGFIGNIKINLKGYCLFGGRTIKVILFLCELNNLFEILQDFYYTLLQCLAFELTFEWLKEQFDILVSIFFQGI
jgi:hypothetical protein